MGHLFNIDNNEMRDNLEKNWFVDDFERIVSGVYWFEHSVTEAEVDRVDFLDSCSAMMIHINIYVGWGKSITIQIVLEWIKVHFGYFY